MNSNEVTWSKMELPVPGSALGVAHIRTNDDEDKRVVLWKQTEAGLFYYSPEQMTFGFLNWSAMKFVHVSTWPST